MRKRGTDAGGGDALGRGEGEAEGYLLTRKEAVIEGGKAIPIAQNRWNFFAGNETIASRWDGFAVMRNQILTYVCKLCIISTKTFWGRGDKKAYNSKTSHLAGLKNVRSMVE